MKQLKEIHCLLIPRRPTNARNVLKLIGQKPTIVHEPTRVSLGDDSICAQPSFLRRPLPENVAEENDADTASDLVQLPSKASDDLAYRLKRRKRSEKTSGITRNAEQARAAFMHKNHIGRTPVRRGGMRSLRALAPTCGMISAGALDSHRRF
jgi:hypothetical protein